MVPELASHEEGLQILDEQFSEVGVHEEGVDIVKQEISRVDRKTELNGNVDRYLLRRVFEVAGFAAHRPRSSLAEPLQHILYLALYQILHVGQQLLLSDVLLV